jgi:hypothetical protein
VERRNPLRTAIVYRYKRAQSPVEDAMPPDERSPDLLHADLPCVLSGEAASTLLAEDDLFHHLMVASPCDAAWDEMPGDSMVRFCQHCRQNVYRLSGMTDQEAVTFVRDTEGRLGVRFYRRRDGTLLAHDCPVGWRSVRRWVMQIGSIVAGSGVAGSLAGFLFGRLNTPDAGSLPFESGLILALGGGLLGVHVGYWLALFLSLAGGRRQPGGRGARH